MRLPNLWCKKVYHCHFFGILNSFKKTIMQPLAPDQKMAGFKKHFRGDFTRYRMDNPFKTKHYLFLCIYLKMYIFAPNTN